ncbi:hypothetical protein AgCh_015489 [Apium graveolens]
MKRLVMAMFYNIDPWVVRYDTGNRSETDIINKIVEEILCNINPTALNVAKYPVGLESHVKDITTLLISHTEGVRGMGGIGKTTLAKALYNQLLLESFKGSCFLANVRGFRDREQPSIFTTTTY